MKLSQLYSNAPSVFKPIRFNEGLNVVMAEIRLPKNRDLDTHNLGKTTLGKLIDFCLLSERDPEFFLFKHGDRFSSFIFYLELRLISGTYITVRRTVSEPTRIWIRKHPQPSASPDISDDAWDHQDVPFERARTLLDSLLDLQALKPWTYRKGLGYLIRSQSDYQEVFKLSRFASKHADWKPFLAHLLGFNATLLSEHYAKEAELAEAQEKSTTIQHELVGTVDDQSKVDGLLRLKQSELGKKTELLNAFDFRVQDKSETKKLVDDLDVRLGELNARRYSLSHSRQTLRSALQEEQILFDPANAQKIFEEAGVLFAGQIKKDFQQLLEFNQAITQERRQYLEEELSEVETELSEIGTEINDLGKRRAAAMGFLSSTDAFEKYRRMSDELVTLKADITSLERQRVHYARLQELRAHIRTLTEEKSQLETKIEADVEAQHDPAGASLFSKIREYFNDIVEGVLARKAVITVSVNSHGHLDFGAEILGEAGQSTSADLGHTYRKLLCIAFDLAVLKAHLPESFPRFVFHDGALESLDDRKKENLLVIIRELCELGLQIIITLIDSDQPRRVAGHPPVFDASEVVLTLHDEGVEGRLFRMDPW